jgi:hypothetical protein
MLYAAIGGSSRELERNRIQSPEERHVQSASVIAHLEEIAFLFGRERRCWSRRNALPITFHERVNDGNVPSCSHISSVDMSPVKRNVTIQLKPELHHFSLHEYERRRCRIQEGSQNCRRLEALVHLPTE